MRLSVVVPTYRRPEHLTRCLEALSRQTRPADQIVVVCRRSDDGTSQIVERSSDATVERVVVEAPGQVAAMLAGARACQGDVIAFTDDDASPRDAWIERLIGSFADPRVGGVGGRDVVRGDEYPLIDDVGRLTRWGKVLDFHHRGRGPARDVAVLKGVNMAFRREALAFPVGLRGEGAQVHNEVATCLWADRRGWRIRYDPAIVVDHDPAQRFDVDQRSAPSPDAIRDAAYNLVIALLSNRPELYWRRATYGLLVGDAAVPGLARATYAAVHGDAQLAKRLHPSVLGQLDALADLRRGRRLEMVPIDG